MEWSKLGVFLSVTGVVVISGVSYSADAAVSGTMNSHAGVLFQADTGVTSPVNPLDPTVPVGPVNPADPNNPHEPGTSGPLSIDYVSNFDFGSQVIESKDKTYYAKLDHVLATSTSTELDVPNFVQVTDKRGSNVGWKLSVKQNGQFATTSGTVKTLNNAVLSFVQGTPKSLTAASYAPTGQAVSLDPNGTSSSTVATAAAGKGMGTWTVAFGADANAAKTGVSLFVPMDTAKEVGAKYETTLTWSLENTPN
ncbi:cell surface protein with WxL domain [Listeria floridensis FSL S10-1187]|uniref:Cell surface protein with WxL domain n=1 Tax=Listeria floridensis FSL S10-1187 TaxID=1265817 RepID=A0ABP3AY86_9LIST|nr:WxL domain-containing protein [Listeria floridensis]EUJ29203.1 cell surface protein with WxL domain [Listeria floridensis FSL S10-1187]